MGSHQGSQVLTPARGRCGRAVGLLFSVIVYLSTASPVNAQDYTAERHRMVREQIQRRGISNPAVLRALRTVPRHEFVPANRRNVAYEDRPLPIGYGQTISQPFIVAYMTEVLELRQASRVLEIGTGSGYQAAVLAEIVDSVYTIEIVPELASEATARLERLGYSNVKVLHADGYHGWPSAAPFDAVIVTAAAQHIPPPLVEQLADTGRMVIPVGTPFLVQSLMLVEKAGGDMRTSSLMAVRFVPFTRAD